MKVSSFISYAWNQIPSPKDITRDKVFSAAQQTLPSVAGTVVRTGIIPLLAAIGLGSTYYALSSTEKRAALAKTVAIACSLLFFGAAAHFYYTKSLFLSSCFFLLGLYCKPNNAVESKEDMNAKLVGDIALLNGYLSPYGWENIALTCTQWRNIITDNPLQRQIKNPTYRARACLGIVRALLSTEAVKRWLEQDKAKSIS